MFQPDIQLRHFALADQDAVKELILSGLVDHFGALDPSLNPDLNNISQSYHRAIFLVAEWEDRVVGTGALIPHGALGTAMK